MSYSELSDALDDLANALSVEFYDVRGVIPSRSQYRSRDLSGVRGLAYHHQAARPTPSAPTQEIVDLVKRDNVIPNGGGRYLSALWGIARYHTGPDSHLASGGAPGIAYTIAVDPDGGIYLCNDPEERTWSQGYAKRPGDENAEWLSVLFMGFFRSADYPDGDIPTPAQLAVAALLPSFLKHSWKPAEDWDLGDTTAHHFLGKPACPGDALLTVVLAHQEHAVAPSSPHYDLDTWRGRQAALNDILDPSPRLAVDGVLGAATKAALRRFQRERGLAADGMWGRKTRAAMVAALA